MNASKSDVLNELKSYLKTYTSEREHFLRRAASYDAAIESLNQQIARLESTKVSP